MAEGKDNKAAARKERERRRSQNPWLSVLPSADTQARDVSARYARELERAAEREKRRLQTQEYIRKIVLGEARRRLRVIT